VLAGDKDMGLPLKGVRIVDLTKDFAGPFCTMMLSDLGAEVVKVEKPGIGDETRTWGPPFVHGQSYYFLSLNRGKKSLCVDLKTREGQQVVKRLVVDSDVLVESLRPEALKKLGLGYPSLRRVNKALIYCSISGFGQTGPYRSRPSYDIVAFAMSGIMSSTGEEGRPPIRVSVPVADIAAGHYATQAILAALARRLVTGTGDYLDISLLDSTVSWLTYNAAYFFATGKQQDRMGSAHPSIVPYQAFMCRDKYLVVAVGNDLQWKFFCEALGLRGLLEDPRFQTNPLRVSNRNLLIPTLSGLFKREKAAYWQNLLVKHNVPVASVYGVEDVMKDPHLKSREVIVRRGRDFPQLSSPMRFSSSPLGKSSRAPRLGENGVEILRRLGYSNKMIHRTLLK
jgi:crotonobetainyl-CoA:carnitine CoA-transferase CaiB-like acyl-CoA transferase